MQYVTTVIIGAGQSGLAFSHCLSSSAIDHVVLERGEVANSWRKERWDSLKLLTPNWQSRLPGYRYQGSDPNGYMGKDDVADYLENYSVTTSVPVRLQTEVRLVTQIANGYLVETNNGNWICQSLVIASGACNNPAIPRVRDNLPKGIHEVNLHQYKNPDQLPDGGVLIVGAAASGAQLASEIQASGRQVTLSVGEYVRVPRVYRERDICWWMDKIGLMDTSYKEVDDIRRARSVASLQLMGSKDRKDIDLNSLNKAGVNIVGRLQGFRGGSALFSGGLKNHCMLADLKMNRLLTSIDEWITVTGSETDYVAPYRFEETSVDESIPLTMDLADRNITTVIWATGYRPDYSWLRLPIFDRKGAIRHDGGIAVDLPGIYVMGLPFMRRRKSSFIDGAGDDAAVLTRHLAASLSRRAA